MVQSAPRPPASNAGDDLVVTLVVAVFQLAWFLSRRTAILIRWAVLFPMLSVPFLLTGYALIASGWQAGVLVGTVLTALLLTWRLLGPATFRRLVTFRLWARRRRHRIYLRPWAQVCALHGLTTILDGRPVIPRLGRVHIGQTTDVLLVQIIHGQTVTDWSTHSEAFAQSFGARNVTVQQAGTGWVRITIRRTDNLLAPIPVPIAVEPVDVSAVRVGVTEAGTHWTVRVLGRHLLIAGATGAGKGSVVWSILAGIAPLLRDGIVQVWVIDPKGGMEFGRGASLFSRFAYDTTDQALALLRDAASILAERAERLRGITRQHVPSVDEPLILIVIDELASLTAYQTDRKIAAEINQLLGIILSQGRAVGVNVVGCVQDPSKDTVSMRQLFPTRIGLRLAEATQVSMVLGAGTRENGALCDLIPDTQPGVGYITEDGATTSTRVRAFHVTDDDIDDLASRFAPRAPELATEPDSEKVPEGGANVEMPTEQ